MSLAPAAADMSAPRLAWPLLATLAVAAPTLLAFNLPPSATFLNQALSLVGWAGWLLVMAVSLPAWPNGLLAWRRRPLDLDARGLAALVTVLVLLALAALASPLWTGLPWSLAGSSLGLIGAALLATLGGAMAQRAGQGDAAFRAFCIGLAVAGVAGSAIGIVQVFTPDLAGGSWVAQSVLEGRAVGNLRQPNHLSSLLMWGIVALLWLGEARVLPRLAALALALAVLFCVVLTGSRTGAVGTVVLAAWGLLDKRLSRPTRVALLLAPVLYALCWAGMTAWAHEGQHVFGGEKQLHKSDPSSSRFGIWANTLALIRMQPWVGVGFGEFNFAWTLTPFPDRPVAFFDHTHNLALQFAVELGLPLAALLTGLLLVALWAAWRAACAASGEAPARRAALVMVVMVAVHSQLEYPLWYAYFLLPAAFAFGLCLGGPGPVAQAAEPVAGRTRPLLVASMWLLLGGLYSVVDYHRVVVIFAPPENATPLPQRVAEGRHSTFFSHHADYAAATTAEHPSDVMVAFVRAPHYLLDARLMMAWARALNEAGQVERARHVAQRLKEFRNDDAAEFFAPCAEAPEPGEALPFQCVAPTVTLDYRDFR